MTEKIKVSKTSEIAEGSAKIIKIGEKEIAVFNINGNFHAISNVCVHKGGPLGEGTVSEDVVTCPWHAWEYDVKSGECLTTPGEKVEKFNVIVENDEVFVEV